MKVAIYSTTPVAGAPYQQYECLKNYADGVEVHHIQQRNAYADGRKFPKDMFLTEAQGRSWIKGADVIHIHNYLPAELETLIDFKRQKVVATLHSFPRQGNWKHLVLRARKTFCIRQPMQILEYKEFNSLPNMFDVWAWTPKPNKDYKGKVNLVYAPSNKHQNDKKASKGYHTVHPLLMKLDARSDIGIIFHTGMDYLQNLRLKREGHVFIDDIIAPTWHLTSLEGACFGAVSLNALPIGNEFPFVHATQYNIEEVINRFLDNRDLMEHVGKKARTWVEQNWNPKEQVKEFVRVYESL